MKRICFETNPEAPAVAFDGEKSPWMSRREAAEYLRCSVDTVDRDSILFEDGPQHGKLRYTTFKHGVRIAAEDVYALLPLPETLEEKI